MVEEAGLFLGCLFLVLISLTANSTHAIVGTAAPMDIGGRKVPGFACGVIDSFQYYGAAIALPATGWPIDKYDGGVWYPTMASFGAIGGCSMLLVMRITEAHDRSGRSERAFAIAPGASCWPDKRGGQALLRTRLVSEQIQLFARPLESGRRKPGPLPQAGASATDFKKCGDLFREDSFAAHA